VSNSLSFTIESAQHQDTLTVNADTYLRSGGPNTNEGSAPFMRIRASGDNRALVSFDQAALQALVGNGHIISATLTFQIVDNANNWGTSGRTIEVHRLTTAWSEGNGYNSDAPNGQQRRGTGAGATWDCGIDSNIANQQDDCNGTTRWEMGKPNQPELHPWDPTVTASALITNGLTGAVTFDVTTDVQKWLAGTAANDGWIIMKQEEGQNGLVSFGSRESGANAPVLVITYTSN
jgi:hypothetical protein